MSRHGGLKKHKQLYSYYGCELYCYLVRKKLLVSRHGGTNKHIQLYSYYGCELYCYLLEKDTKCLDMEFRTNTYNCIRIMAVTALLLGSKRH